MPAATRTTRERPRQRTCMTKAAQFSRKVRVIKSQPNATYRALLVHFIAKAAIQHCCELVECSLAAVHAPESVVGSVLHWALCHEDPCRKALNQKSTNIFLHTTVTSCKYNVQKHATGAGCAEPDCANINKLGNTKNAKLPAL